MHCKSEERELYWNLGPSPSPYQFRRHSHHQLHSSFMKSLIEFPPECLSNVLYFLPQQLLVNLALTNYFFYEPCLRKLYKRIQIQASPVLKANSRTLYNTRRDDFIDSSTTIICGFSSLSMPKDAHLKMVEAKIRTLTTAILINPQLASFIESVTITDVFDKDIELALLQLFKALALSSNQISKIYISDKSLRTKLGYRSFKYKFPSLSSVTIDDISEISELTFFKNIKTVIIADLGSRTINTAHIRVLSRLEHLLINQDPTLCTEFHSLLSNHYKKEPFQLQKLKTVNLVHTHDDALKYPYLVFPQLVNIQLSLGCNKPDTCGQECVENFLAPLELPKVKRLAIVQNSRPSTNNHRNTEKWDLVVFEFVKLIVDHSDSLFYLSIRHNVPLDGIIDDGFEGNYLRKVQLYTRLLPNLLATIQKHVVNLVLPNLVASLSCYEQPMNTFMWNGCKCDHCDKYLTKLDHYLLYHRYFSFERQVFKDILTTQLMRSMSEVLCDRMSTDQNVGDLFHLHAPMRNVSWNFHNSKFSIPYTCLPVKNYEMAQFEDDKDEKIKGREQFFDAEEVENDCQFLQNQDFYPDYTVVVSHFLNDLIRRMINLNRGDAEDVNIGLKQDENDGFTDLRINKMLINGIDYNFDHEINGTIFFRNSYDELEEDLGTFN